MSDVRVGLPTVFIVSAIVGAAAFALGRSTSSPPSVGVAPPPPAAIAPDIHTEDPHSHGVVGGGGTDLPPGHPAVGSPGPAPEGSFEPKPASPTDLSWKAPARWKVMPNTSAMRLATYRVPRAEGDTTDADVSVMQAGGSIDANVTRWLGQFDGDAGRRRTKKVGSFEVTIVESEGTYAGGMSGGTEKDWALLGAIVDTPDMPHFFKIVGPKKTVASARAELDQLLQSLTLKANAK